ncbi:OsmC family protein [Tunicatimonas pelagia]|uniref:OsmC family protein n=1 Tax=Tunicatimonas pelagia TaxID=931531 RepID=UPI0026669F3B|nr:OsmC family protein [Tunicatimonas pelagia]WKN44346.1 OsmC family protein [Tunicatimonas pelagia]
MQIKIKRLNDATHLEASNEDGLTLQMDGSPDVGGKDLAMRPMQVLLSSLGGCSAMDVISILNKQRQPLDDIQFTLDGTREEGKVPAVFTKIHITYDLYGNLDEDKVKRAIDLSMQQYCSVTKMLEKTAKITYSFKIHPSS